MNYLKIPLVKRNAIIELYCNGYEYNIDYIAKYTKLSKETVVEFIDDLLVFKESSEFDKAFAKHNGTGTDFALHYTDPKIKEAYDKMMCNYNSDIAE